MSKPVWQQFALCSGTMRDGKNLWFSERNKYKALKAKEICAQCPVQEPCSEAGMSERIGVWGGVNVSVHESRR